MVSQIRLERAEVSGFRAGGLVPSASPVPNLFGYLAREDLLVDVNSYFR
jgi:hypothetical protein